MPMETQTSCARVRLSVHTQNDHSQLKMELLQILLTFDFAECPYTEAMFVSPVKYLF